ncbi:MAG TPA: thioesterase family protein [Isosphaeraceae bacterium]|nr:thioesterase family protein [Isosphaeraceae bacterium]
MANVRAFEYVFRVEHEDIDRLGHVNNVVYLKYAQDAAVAHWQAVIPHEIQESLVWVVRRHEIDYLKPAVENDMLVARTWVGEPIGATLERFIEIRRCADGELLASVRSVWVALDAKALRPRRVTEQLCSFFRVGVP